MDVDSTLQSDNLECPQRLNTRTLNSNYHQPQLSVGNQDGDSMKYCHPRVK